MPEEFEGDLREAVFWGAEMQRARFRDVDLTGARISHAMVVDVEIDAQVDRLVVNGVDVTDYVNERDRWYPLRAMLVPKELAHLRVTWDALAGEWAQTLELARSLPEAMLDESVDGEWSFVQTLRHVVFAMDKWWTAPVLEEGFHPMGLPNTGSLDFPWPGLDLAAAPSFAEALAVREARNARFSESIDALTAADWDRRVDVLENGPHALHDCAGVVFEEEFWHNRYARRDLETLRARR